MHRGGIDQGEVTLNKISDRVEVVQYSGSGRIRIDTVNCKYIKTELKQVYLLLPALHKHTTKTKSCLHSNKLVRGGNSNASPT